MRWLPFEDGASLGREGSEFGVIILDEEYDGRARITLERDGSTAPFSVTCGVYGSFFHTRYCGSAEEADIDEMKGALGSICELAARYQDSEDHESRMAVYTAIDAFVSEYP